MININDLVKLNKPGVFALINPVDKKVYVGMGVSMLKTITRIMDDLKTNQAYTELSKDFTKLELVILETGLPRIHASNLRIRLSVHTKKYESDGYSLYSSYKGLRLRVNTFLDPLGLVNVEVVSSSNKRVIVGIFKLVSVADRFIRDHYTPITKIIYADNTFTKQYRNKLKV